MSRRPVPPPKPSSSSSSGSCKASIRSQDRQAPQGEESHSPSTPDARQFPLLSKLLPRTPGILPLSPAEDRVVSSGPTHVFLSESQPVRRGSQQLPPKSPKSPRSPRLGQVGKSRSTGGYTAAGSPVSPQQVRAYLSTSPSSGAPPLPAQLPIQSNHTYAVPCTNVPPLPPPWHPPPATAHKLANGSRTRSHPNLINDYVNLESSPDRSRILEPESVSALRKQLDMAHARAQRVDALERELARLSDTQEALVKQAERNAHLELVIRQRLERECSTLRKENSSLRDQLSKLASSSTGSPTDLLRKLVEKKDLQILLLEQENEKLKGQQSHSSPHTPL